MDSNNEVTKVLRIAKAGDVPAMCAIYGEYVKTTTATFEYEAPTEAEFFRRFETYTRQFPWLVWEENGELLGYVYAAPPYSRPAYGWCAEPTIYLKPEARGKEIGGKLYAALEMLLQRQGYQILYALVCDENTISQRFHEKMGYQKRAHFPNCGFKFGRWMGLYWMEKRLSDVIIPKAPPVSWKVFVQDAEKLGRFLEDL